MTSTQPIGHSLQQILARDMHILIAHIGIVRAPSGCRDTAAGTQRQRQVIDGCCCWQKFPTVLAINHCQPLSQEASVGTKTRGTCEDASNGGYSPRLMLVDFECHTILSTAAAVVWTTQTAVYTDL